MKHNKNKLFIESLTKNSIGLSTKNFIEDLTTINFNDYEIYLHKDFSKESPKDTAYCAKFKLFKDNNYNIQITNTEDKEYFYHCLSNGYFIPNVSELVGIFKDKLELSDIEFTTPYKLYVSRYKNKLYFDYMST